MDCIVSAPGHLRFYFPPTDWDGMYDAFAVTRSRGGDAGPYEELMASSWGSAFFSIPYRNFYNVAGKQLDIQLDGRIDATITLASTVPYNVAYELDNLMPGFLHAVYTVDQDIKIYGSNVGMDASMRVGGDAAALLGLVPDDTHYGIDQYRRLTREVCTYDFVDPRGLVDDFYQVRLFRLSAPNSFLKYPPVPGALRGGLDASHLIAGTIELYDLTGRPVEHVLVSLYSPQRALGIYPASVNAYTDQLGRAMLMVVRGAALTMSISGTNLAREIVVPMEGDTFDLLDPAISVDNDAYKVQVPNIIVGERRSL